ncbi:MAG: hypothetical protein OEV42_09680 [Deltaproteobacteria bacterium]|nr:hypothetical protein [Deltaproteobacteria bacterium]
MSERNYPPEYDKKLNAQRLREGLENHIMMVTEKSLSRYGKMDSLETFLEALNNREVVRFPTVIDYNELALEDNQSSRLDRVNNGKDECYCITLHPRFKGRDEDVIALALYRIVKINYGKIAKEKEALLFGSSILGIDEDAYEAWLTRLENEVN